ncbi:hypothetical protein AAFN88_01260 [Pelagibius sp. CAU 1746]|uniref:hypothetical protein n=1 Tax=Pelagibius sp. CAU 1746 TaxID=3140370 RepID=UPI00325AE902
MASASYNVLILGASYGSLLATKLSLAGHNATLVCLPEEAELINAEGTRVRMPVKGREGLVEIDSRNLPGKLNAATTDQVDPADYDLMALAMQEPQYRADGPRGLLAAAAKAKVPCLSIMNMPPKTFLARIPGLDTEALRECYTDASIWDALDPSLMTLVSPDPQAFRPPEESLNVLQVSLPTNFKAAPFESEQHTRMLRDIEASIDAIRFDTEDGKVELPVKLRVHDSLYVPLAKWAMLLTGNYRCVGPDSVRPIREAVHGDVETSRKVFDWVCNLCVELGAAPEDLVPFEKYANAAKGLAKPSSVARALDAGARDVERVDKLIHILAKQRGLQLAEVDEIVATVDARLRANRAGTA